MNWNLRYALTRHANKLCSCGQGAVLGRLGEGLVSALDWRNSCPTGGLAWRDANEDVRDHVGNLRDLHQRAFATHMDAEGHSEDALSHVGAANGFNTEHHKETPFPEWGTT